MASAVMPGTPADAYERGADNKWFIAVAVALGALLEVVDTSIVNVALNEMQNSLGATLTEVSWVVSSYAVANVIILPMTAWLGERFGKKRYFIFSLVAFTLASMLCGMAQNLPMLIVARVIQGFGAAGIMSVNTALVRFTYPHKYLGRGIGINAFVVAVAAAAQAPASCSSASACSRLRS